MGGLIGRKSSFNTRSHRCLAGEAGGTRIDLAPIGRALHGQIDSTQCAAFASGLFSKLLNRDFPDDPG